ncbi:MAG: hypothetical protein H0U73_00885 [Tatlockia sp.]|nr:hypothetical protein [Tatlockia sp.]
MIVRLFMSLIAIFFPWLVLLIEDNPGGAVIALVMQASVIGWPFAAFWALRVQGEGRKVVDEERRKVKEQKAKEKAEKKQSEEDNKIV